MEWPLYELPKSEYHILSIEQEYAYIPKAQECMQPLHSHVYTLNKCHLYKIDDSRYCSPFYYFKNNKLLIHVFVYFSFLCICRRMLNYVSMVKGVHDIAE